MDKTICSCIICKSQVTTNNISKHYGSKQCNNGGKFVFKKIVRENPENLHCQYCNSERKSANSLVQHEIRCESNPNKIDVSPAFGMTGKKGANQFTKAKRLGLPPPVVSESTREKIRANNKKIVWSEERRKRLSESMKTAVEQNPESYSSSNRGRTKQIIFDGIKFQGQWELIFYQYCKQNGIKIERPETWFEYNWNGKRKYFPDFYLPEKNLYVEVKGYETERDRAKWRDFPYSLTIIRKHQIEQISKGVFSGL